MLDLLKAAILIPIGIIITILVWMFIAFIFIALAFVIAAPFILIIGAVLLILF